MVSSALILLSLLLTPSLRAASCCGGGGGTSLLIVADNEAQVSLFQSQNKVIGDTDRNGNSVFRNENNQEIVDRSSLSLSKMWGPFWQTGAIVNWQNKTRKTLSGRSESNRGLGDIGLFVGYEFLPEITYSAWRPRGFVTMDINLPTATSIHDSQSELATDTRGSGFYSASLGATFFKSWGEYSYSLFGKSKFSLESKFANQTISPGPEFSLGTTLSHDFFVKDITWSLGLAHQYKTGKKSEGENFSSNRQKEYFWDTTVSFIYNWNDDYSFTLSYLDQTIMGPTQNTTLSRELAFGFTRNFPL